VPGTEINVTQRSGVAVVAMVGEHDAGGADALVDALREQLAARLPVLVDLADATFVDSTILGVLLRARQQADRAGLPFALVVPADPAAPVRRLVEVTMLRGLFAIYDDPAAATTALRIAAPDPEGT
jgi:anti-anti-sigma factor